MEILETDRPLTVEEIEDLCELDTNSWHNRQLFARTIVPETFIIKHWNEFDEAGHHNCIVHQRLSDQFLDYYWGILTENERKACFQHQKLSMEFLLREWLQIEPNSRLIIAKRQILTPAFITLFWQTMDWWWKVKCIAWQKKFPARLVIDNWEEANHSLYIAHHQRRVSYYSEDLTMAELPENLSCELETIRTSAATWLSELQRRERHAYEQETRTYQ